MTSLQRRLLLAVIVVLELAAAALVLWWFFRPTDQAPPPTPSPVAAPTATPTAGPPSIWVAPQLPDTLVGAIQVWADQQSDELAWTEASAADLVVDWKKRAWAEPLSEIVLVPAVPFFSLRDDVTLDELRRIWLGEAQPDDTVTHIFISPETAQAADALFGPRSAQASVTTVSGDELVDLLWAEPEALSLVPFDRLEPRLKALSVGGLSALDPELDLGRYPLRAMVWVKGPHELQTELVAEIERQRLDTNRHLDRLTVLAMTGVTALTRGIAHKMEITDDYAWPARQVADFLSSADLTHVSNEVSFQPGCQVDLDTWVFCSKPEYMETLQLVGADLVELTGNHNLDFGAHYAQLSLDLYAQAGMQTFGGGRNAAEARQPLLLTHNGNRLAFLGYSQFGPDYAWATESRPGAAQFSLDAAQSDLAQVRAQADAVFVNIQHTEAYQAKPLPEQVVDFRAVADAGADVVTGSQAHQPQAIEFRSGKPIFYGLGNLFFDQTWSDETRQGLIIRHVIYDGRLIASQVIPTVIGADLQTYLAKGEERVSILKMVFGAGDW